MFKLILKKLRKEKKITQVELAKILNVDSSTVAKWEGKDNIIPSVEVLKLIADFFNVSLDYLTGREQSINPPTSGNWIPVLGNVQAGIPVQAVEDILDYEEISDELAASGEYVALKIKGSSMEPKMSDGDVVIVRLQEDIDSGQIAVVMVNGDEATVKKIKKSPEGLMLIPLNSAFEPIFYSNDDITALPVRIFGRVIELRAKF